MSGTVACGLDGPKLAGFDAQDFCDGIDAFARDLSPLRNCSGADTEMLCDPLNGAATLEQVIKEGIAHGCFLSGARSRLQPQTKRVALRGLWQTLSMSERELKPRQRNPKPAEKNPKAVALGKRLAIARDKKGLSQPQLAIIIGISSGAIGQYEVGIAMPRPEKIEKLAVALDVTTEWLLTGNEPDEMVRAQTRDEQEALRLMRLIPSGEHATALAIWETLSRQKLRDTKK